MSEESILILNMLREGKITAEQADSLLRAVRTTAPTPPAPPQTPTPAPAPAIDPATLAQMQNKLGELQGKLGDLQGKLGAAQAARAAGQAASFMGKAFDHLPKGELDFTRINKSVDEALRGLSAFKNDAVRTAKVAARQAGQEARRAAKQGKQAFDDLGFTVTTEAGERRPAKADGQTEASDVSECTVTWAGADRLSVGNAYGNLQITGTEAADGAATATLTKTAWAATDAEARVLLQQVFLTSRVEGGQCRVEVVAPADAKDRLAVDYVLRIPRQLPIEADTTFGTLTLEETSAQVTAASDSGSVIVRRPSETGLGDAKATARGGHVRLEQWNAPQTTLAAETTSGDITGDNLSCRTLEIKTRSGDITLQKAQTVAEAVLETTSGDASAAGGSVGTRLLIKTQSGAARVTDIRAETVQVETVSGDARAEGVAGTLSVKTVSGDIVGEAIASLASALGTVSGDARWTFAAPFSGSLAATSVSGDVRVGLWSNSDARVEMSTTSGEITSRLTLENAAASGARSLSGVLGAGTGSIKLQSVSGDLTLEESR